MAALPAPGAALEEVSRSVLGSQLRVALVDGRVLQGRLHCLDWKQNILLRDTTEVGQAGATGSRKSLGLVAVEARHVVRYERARPAPQAQAAAPLDAALSAPALAQG